MTIFINILCKGLKYPKEKYEEYIIIIIIIIKIYLYFL